MTVDIRPAASRFHTDAGWLDSWHSFSFGPHHDPANTQHGLLVVSNDDRVAAGGGFGTHGHRDMEIVTWVLDGELAHRDSTGTDDVIRPGLAQRMSAGSGIRHSEMNASADVPVHFVQMWVVPDTAGVEPGYEQLDISGELASGGLVPVASGQGHEAAISIHQRDATLFAARLDPGATAEEYATHLRTEFSTFSWLFEPMLERSGFTILDREDVIGFYGAYTCRR